MTNYSKLPTWADKNLVETPRGLIDLPPTRLDLALGKSAANLAQPSIERSLRVVTWLADEKLMLSSCIVLVGCALARTI